MPHGFNPSDALANLKRAHMQPLLNLLTLRERERSDYCRSQDFEKRKTEVRRGEVKENVPREFYMSCTDAERFGKDGLTYRTRGCAGCKRWDTGRSRLPHSDECRAN